MLRDYEAWETEDGFVFFSSDQLHARMNNPAQKLVRKLFDVAAATGEEAMSIFNLRMGWGPYNPMGKPENCPKCGGWFYPEGSGDCWQCGKIC
jgi:hypothetical protein